MRCFFHQATDASATCNACSRALCAACASRFTLMLCEPCLVDHNRAVTRRLWTNLAATALGYAIGLALCSALLPPDLSGRTSMLALMALGFPSAFWGWTFLDRRISRTFLILPIWGWIAMLWFKFVVAAFVGALVMPWQVVSSIVQLLRSKRTRAALTSRMPLTAPLVRSAMYEAASGPR